MNSDFEITIYKPGYFRLKRKEPNKLNTSYFNEGIYFTKYEISDIIHNLMFYIPDEEAF